MYYQNESDETLVMLTLAGEQSAYEVLVIRYQKAVIASAITITKNHFMAEDAAQDAFVTAWMKLNTLQEPKKYGSWVCRIAKNCALNMISRVDFYISLSVQTENLTRFSAACQMPVHLHIKAKSRRRKQAFFSVTSFIRIFYAYFFLYPHLGQTPFSLRAMPHSGQRSMLPLVSYS